MSSQGYLLRLSKISILTGMSSVAHKRRCRAANSGIESMSNAAESMSEGRALLVWAEEIQNEFERGWRATIQTKSLAI
jgi:hypothetical protein